MNVRFSVIIPLYNKESEVERAIRSVLAQTHPPLEIVVVDDGSTDGSAAVVEGIVAEHEAAATRKETGSPLIRLIRQKNAGETAARNRGMAEASGDHFALIDADDEWRPEFIETITALIEEFPNAGLYCTGFEIVRDGKATPARTPVARGIVTDYFREAMTKFVATASSSVLPRAVIERVGGFPEGMRLGGDQYMWTKIAREYPVAFTPVRLAVIHASASNRSAATYKPEATEFSFRDFYDETGDSAANVLNEYIARVALGKAITISVKGGTEEALSDERFFAYNRLSRRLWLRLWVLNRLPASLRGLLNDLYNRLAWRLAKRGL